MIINEVTRKEPHLSFEPEILIPEIPKVQHNLDVVKQYAIDLKEFWQPVIFTSEQVDKAKEVKANINKLVKTVADLRKYTIKKYKEPIEDFEKTAKETENILKEASDVLNQKINVFVEQEQQKKLEKIKEIIENLTTGTFVSKEEIVFDQRWLNKTYKTSQIEEDITNQIDNILTVKKAKKLAKENLKLKLEQLDPAHLLTHEVYLTKLDYVGDADLVYQSAVNHFNSIAKIEISKTTDVDINSIFSNTVYKATFEGTFDEIQKIREFAKENNIKEV